MGQGTKIQCCHLVFPCARAQRILVVVSDWLTFGFCGRDMLHNRTHEVSWHPYNVLSPRLVELRATCRGDKTFPKLVLLKCEKSVSLHEGTCDCNTSLIHVPATFLVHVPATCLKWLLPEVSIPAAGQKDRRLWGRECV